MTVIVAKFGGTSLADGGQFRKIRQIVEEDPDRRFLVVSAPGKRFSGDHKITDLLYLCAAHIQYGVEYDDIFDMIRSRFSEIAQGCGLATDLSGEFDALRERMGAGAVSRDELASRGEYFTAQLMAEYLAIRKHTTPPVVRLQYGQCSGCNTSLPSATLSKIRSGALVECETCGRMIIQ